MSHRRDTNSLFVFDSPSQEQQEQLEEITIATEQITLQSARVDNLFPEPMTTAQSISEPGESSDKDDSKELRSDLEALKMVVSVLACQHNKECIGEFFNIFKDSYP